MMHWHFYFSRTFRRLVLSSLTRAVFFLRAFEFFQGISSGPQVRRADRSREKKIHRVFFSTAPPAEKYKEANRKTGAGKDEKPIGKTAGFEKEKARSFSKMQVAGSKKSPATLSSQNNRIRTIRKSYQCCQHRSSQQPEP